MIWVGCKTTGRRTSGGVVVIGSRTQDSLTLSFVEAGLVALGKLAMEMRAIGSMTQEWFITDESSASQLYADASASLSIAKRQGRGR